MGAHDLPRERAGQTPRVVARGVSSLGTRALRRAPGRHTLAPRFGSLQRRPGILPGSIVPTTARCEQREPVAHVALRAAPVGGRERRDGWTRRDCLRGEPLSSSRIIRRAGARRSGPARWWSTPRPARIILVRRGEPVLTSRPTACPEEPSPSDQANLPAQEAPSRQGARLPRAHEVAGRPQGARRAASTWPQEAHRLTPGPRAGGPLSMLRSRRGLRPPRQPWPHARRPAARPALRAQCP